MKYRSLLTLPILTLMLSACTTDNSSTSSLTNKSNSTSSSSVDANHWDKDETLKILTIGNSFSDDSMEYVAEIALSLGIKEVRLGNLYIGGCSLQTHHRNALYDNASYEYRTNNGEGWSTIRNYRMSDAIASEDWDFISLQQSSGLSGLPTSYEPYLTELIEMVLELAPESKIVWNMTWAYQQNSTHNDFNSYDKNQIIMYEAIVNAVNEQVVSNELIELVIPTGTSIQNARTSFFGDNLTRDGYHLTYDLGRYIAGLTFVHKLTGIDIVDAFSPVNNIYKNIAVDAVKNAVLNPFEISESAYKNEPEFNTEDYTLLDLELTELGYWNSNDANYNTIFTTAGNSNQFFASKRFVEEEIPLNSVIVIENGWQYRPEAWKSDSRQATRPSNVSVKYTFVDESFWDGYLYRAFNISKIGTPSLENSKEEARNALKIYIPKN